MPIRIDPRKKATTSTKRRTAKPTAPPKPPEDTQEILVALMRKALDLTDARLQTVKSVDWPYPWGEMQHHTETVSKLQSQIYLELDKGTDNSARAKLQSELPEMKGMLKRLREGTRSEFACFKKAKTDRSAK